MYRGELPGCFAGLFLEMVRPQRTRREHVLSGAQAKRP